MLGYILDKVSNAAVTNLNDVLDEDFFQKMVMIKVFLYQFKEDSADVGPEVTIERWDEPNYVAFSIPTFNVCIDASVWDVLYFNIVVTFIQGVF